MIRQYSTINTFSRRPVAAQIITYLVFIGEALTFFICMYINYSNLAKKIIILVLYIATMIAQIILALVTSCTDPSDDIMIEYRNNPNNRRTMSIQNCLYCDICTSYVQQTSRHCKVCQRCVQKFDHHCMWINNCIGEKNYAQFMAMTVVTFVNLGVYIAGMVLLWTENEWQAYLGAMVTVWVYSFLVGAFSILLINLIGLHFYLIYKGITTYQFIMLQRDQETKKRSEEQIRSQEIEQNIPAAKIGGSQYQINQNKIPNRQNSLERIAPVVHKRIPSGRHQSVKHENTGEVIFGMSANENEAENNRTQKSQEISQQNNHNLHQKMQLQQNNYNQEDQPSSLNSKAENQQNLSNFFTKNKSLKFFIGDEIGSRPKSSKNAQILSKQKLFRSARVVEMQSRKEFTHQSQNKYRKKSSSIEINGDPLPHQKIQVLQYQQKGKIMN